MAVRKRKASRTRRTQSPRLTDRLRQGLTGAMGRRAAKLLTWVVVLAAAATGMWRLELYVKNITSQRQVQLTASMANPPRWASDELIREILLSTGIHHDDFILDDDLTGRWAQQLSQNPWVKRINSVRKHYNGEVTFDCELRRPIAMVRQGISLRYIDAEGVVLPDASLVKPYGHVIELRGSVASPGEPGHTLRDPAMIAGIQVLARIRGVDEQLKTDERLWQELAQLDVANYNGRRDQAASHLTFYTNNNTEVRWGAAVGSSLSYGEASARCKIATLYRKHKLAGSLELFPHVELRDPPKDQPGWSPG